MFRQCFKIFFIDNMKSLLDVYDFSVDYDSIDVADILYIHKYFMKKA